MRYIAELEIINFMSHRHSFLEFGKPTSIIGENNHGKSVIVRALDLVLNNKAFPASKVTRGESEASIKVTFSDGSSITRKRSKNKQTCVIMQDGKETTYANIASIAEIVENFTGFRYIALDKKSKPESLQVIPVHAGQSFMVSGMSSETVLRRFNRLTSGGAVGSAKSVIKSALTKLDSEHAVLTSQYEIQEKLVEALENPGWDTVTTKLNSLEKSFQTASDIADHILRLQEAEDEWNSTDMVKISTDSKKVAALQALLDAVRPLVADAMTAFGDCIKIKQANKICTDDLSILKNLKAELKKATKTLVDSTTEYNNAKTAMSGVCPACGRKL